MKTKFLILFIAFFPIFLEGQKVPRTVITFYDREMYPLPIFSDAHQFAEMPCNHLGLVFEYHDIWQPLPDLSERDDVIGVLSWFDDTKLTQEEALKFFNWSIDALKKGKKYVIFGKVFFDPGTLNLPIHRINEFWEYLGLRVTGNWVDDTFQTVLERPFPFMTGFEREYPKALPQYMETIQVSDQTTSYLDAVATNREYSKVSLISTSKNGGYVASAYGIYSYYKGERGTRAWYIDPFLYFRKVFDLEDVPVPDTTTASGRRIYYSQIDGDGWNNQTEISSYPWDTISAVVLYDQILKRYPDLPVAVAPIAADIDLKWVGTEASRMIAKKIFKLPNVEVSCHTFTHPFNWPFFEDYTPEKEVPYLSSYPNGSWLGTGLVAKFRGYMSEKGHLFGSDTPSEGEVVHGHHREKGSFEYGYKVPRAYALKPFNLNMEVEGAVKEIETVSDGRPVVLYQWSGDCLPFYEIVKLVKDAGLQNINGGETRFDSVYPSYAWVSALGRNVGGLWQVFASNSNEDIYTNLWRSDFFGFILLQETFKNTESPIRIRPANLYYHIYSAQKTPSLKALEQNIAYIRAHQWAPIRTSTFSRIVEGFYKTGIEKTGDKTWKFRHNGGVQTIRFDRSSLLTVDYEKSAGVIGHNYLQGSLYACLDPAYQGDHVVSLKDNSQFYRNPSEPRFYLIESRWLISHFENPDKGQMTCKAVGFGPGEMTWNVPQDGNYEVSFGKKGHLLVPSKNQQIEFVVQDSAIDPLEITIKMVK